jgi:class 3 adenylate cyclase
MSEPDAVSDATPPPEPERIRRRLAAILAADVAGYSRLMGLDEEGTTRQLIDARKVMDDLIAHHGGRIANTAGDSVIAEFESSVEAVRCALDIQEAMRSRNRETLADRRVQFRIGINVGDVIARDGDLLGDGVNVASRIEGLAEPGGICLSGEVHDQIEGKLTLTCVPMGKKSLKNIRRPVRTYRIVTGAAPGQWRARHAVAFLATGLMAALLALAGLVWGDRIVALVGQGQPAGGPTAAARPPPAQPLAAGRAREVARATWEGHDYIAMQVWGTTWAEAEATARAMGGHLVSITTAEENAVVYDLIAGEPDLWVEYDDGQMFGPWIGLYQPHGSDEPKGGWTLSSGEPVTYLNWSRGQPNNFGGDSNFARFHNEVALPSPFWDDSPTNSSANGFIVERVTEPAAAEAGAAAAPETAAGEDGG